MSTRRPATPSKRRHVIWGTRRISRAQRLRTGQADTIALLSSMPFAVAAGPSRLGFLMEVAAVAAASAIENGLALVLVPPLEKARPVLDRLGIDGALVLEPTAEDAGVAHLRDRGVPVVTIGRQARTDDAPPYVDLRSAATAQLLLDHLKDQGSRRVVLLIGAQARNSYQETEYAYRAFAQAHGMAPLVRRLDERGGEQFRRSGNPAPADRAPRYRRHLRAGGRLRRRRCPGGSETRAARARRRCRGHAL